MSTIVQSSLRSSAIQRLSQCETLDSVASTTITWILTDCLPVANALIEQHGGRAIGELTVTWDLRGRSAGVALRRKSERRIRLNQQLLQMNDSLTHVIDTALHELAHICVFQINHRLPPHGELWQQFAAHLGAEPGRCHQLPLQRSRKSREFRYQTAAGEIWLGTVRHKRLQSGRQRYFTRGGSPTEIRASDHTGHVRTKKG